MQWYTLTPLERFICFADYTQHQKYWHYSRWLKGESSLEQQQKKRILVYIDFFDNVTVFISVFLSFR